jgi:hypothetical protein
MPIKYVMDETLKPVDPIIEAKSGTVRNAAKGGTISHENKPPINQYDSHDQCVTFLKGK